MKLFTAILLFTSISASCWWHSSSNKKTKITVFNSSKVILDSIRIASYGTSQTYVNLSPQTRQEKVLDVTDQNYEGAFTVLVFVKDSLVQSSTFGYFSKVKDIEDRYDIEIGENFTISGKP